MPGEIMFDEERVNSEAIPCFNQVLERLNYAVSSLAGIDTSDLGIDLGIDAIKNSINGNISTISQIKTNIMTVLDEYIQVEKDNLKIVELIGDLFELSQEEKLNLLRSLEQQEEKLTNIWINGIKHKLEGISDDNGNTLYYVAIPIMDVDENSDELKPAVVFLDVPEKDENGNRLADYTFDVDDETKAFQGFDGYVIIPAKENSTPEEVIDITEKILNKPDKYKINPKQIALTGKGNVKGIYNAVNEKNETFTFCSYMNKIDIVNQTRECFEKIFGIVDTPETTSDDDPILPKPIGDRELGNTQYYYDYESMGFLVDKVYLNEEGEVVYQQKVPGIIGLYQNEGTFACGGYSRMGIKIAQGGKIGNKVSETPSVTDISDIYYDIYSERLEDGSIYGGHVMAMEFDGCDVVYRSTHAVDVEEKDIIMNYLRRGYMVSALFDSTTHGESYFTSNKHYMDGGGIMLIENEEGQVEERIIVYDSALYCNGKAGKTIAEREERYLQGFTEEEFFKVASMAVVIAPEFRTEYLRVDATGNFVITEDGQLMQIDFSEVPEYVGTTKLESPLFPSCTYPGNASKGWIYYELADADDPDTKINVVQTSKCPIQYPSNPTKTLADAVNDGDITLDEALNSIEYAVENGNISNEKAQELIDGLPKS